MAISKKTWLPARECAERLGVTLRQVQRYIEKKDIPCVKQARAWYVCLEDTRDHCYRIQALKHPQVDLTAIAQEAREAPPAHLPPPDEVGWEAQVASLRARVALLEYQTDNVRPARWTREQAAHAFRLFATFTTVPRTLTIVTEFAAMLPSVNDSLRHAWIDAGHRDRLWPRVLRCIERAMRYLSSLEGFTTTLAWQATYHKLQIQLERIRALALEEMPYPDRVAMEEALHATTQSSILEGLLRTLRRRSGKESETAFSLVSLVYYAMQEEEADDHTRHRWADALRNAIGLIESNVIGRPREEKKKTTDHPLDRLVEASREWEESGSPDADLHHKSLPHAPRLPTERKKRPHPPSHRPDESERHQGVEEEEGGEFADTDEDDGEGDEDADGDDPNG